MTRSGWTNVLFLAYPLLVHAAIVTGSAGLTLASLLVLASNILGPWLWRRRPWAWAAWAAIVAASLVFVGRAGGRTFLYAAPVLVALALLWFFGRSLLPGQVPLITRIAQAIRGPLPGPVVRYTRRVTKLWVATFAVLALGNLLLALFAPPLQWSLFTNFINYLLVAALFVLEWLFRCWYMRAYESLTWWEYLSALRQFDYRSLLA